MELFLARVYPETINIIGRCYRNAFLRYIQIKVSKIIKGIRKFMSSTRAFYTIFESGVM